MRRVSVVLSLMATVLAVSALKLDVAVDDPLLSIITGDEAPDDAPTPCCDEGCDLIRFRPPQYRCVDVKDHCNPGCKDCVCTKSIPPQCKCTDVWLLCPLPCPDGRLPNQY